MTKRKAGSISDEVLEKFASTVGEESHESDGHWLWDTRSTSSIRLNGNRYNVMRLAWIYYKSDPVSDDERIKKLCTKPGCFNPDHHRKLSLNLNGNNVERKKLRFTEEDWLDVRTRLQKNYLIEGEHKIWTGPKNRDGYGITSLRTKGVAAHVLSWESHHEKFVPEGMIVRHKCKRKDCVNPDHLELGTYVDNNGIDKLRDGTDCRGRNHPNANIDDKTALDIFNSQGSASVKERAKRFGVTFYTVKNIDRGISWAWLTGIEKHERTTKTNSAYFFDNVDENKEILRKLQQHCDIVKDTESATSHWLWKLKTDTSGYGKTQFRAKKYSSHVLSCQAFYARVKSEKEVVRHKCKFRNCCNPKHLEFGSHTDNAMDRYRDETMTFGDNSHLSKMSEDVARMVKYSKGNGTAKQRAERYGVTLAMVYHIDNGESWKHI